MNGELNRSPENIGVGSRKGLADIQACEGRGKEGGVTLGALVTKARQRGRGQRGQFG